MAAASGSKRQALAERRLQAAEDAYERVLKDALAECAAGAWGLFGQNPFGHGVREPAVVEELRSLATTIDAQRATLGLAPFQLHARFEALRGRKDANQPGEPKIAAIFLEELRDG